MNSVTRKTEKLQKKFKIFYDSKIKAKTRLSALRFYLGRKELYSILLSIHLFMLH